MAEDGLPFRNCTDGVLRRYLRLRARHPSHDAAALWLGARRLLRQLLNRRAATAGSGHVHPHQFRHTMAHQFR